METLVGMVGYGALRLMWSGVKVTREALRVPGNRLRIRYQGVAVDYVILPRLIHPASPLPVKTGGQCVAASQTQSCAG